MKERLVFFPLSEINLEKINVRGDSVVRSVVVVVVVVVLDELTGGVVVSLKSLKNKI